MACEIILHWNGEEHSFSSNEELDGWLYSNKGQLYLKEKDITYSLTDPQKLGTDSITAMANTAQKETFGRIRKIMNTRVSIDTGAAAASMDPRKRVVKVDWSYASNYVGLGSGNDVYRPSRKPYTGSMSKEESTFRKTLGHDFEEAFEHTIRPEYIPKYSKLRTPDSIKALEDAAAAVLNWIHSKHGENCEILTQVKVGTNVIGSSLLSALRIAAWDGWDVTKRGGDSKNINAFVGDIDMIVIDGSGVAYPYDFKTSSLNPTVDSDPTYGKQIGIYRQILRQGEVETGAPALIDITTEYDKNGFVNNDSYITGISFDEKHISELGENHTISKLVNDWFKDNMRVKFTEIKDTVNVMGTFVPNSSLASEIKFRKKEVDEEMNSTYDVKQTHPLYKDEYRIQYTKPGRPKDNERYLYAKTHEEMRKKIEDYLEEYNEDKAGTYGQFAKDLKRIMSIHSISELRKVAADINKNDVKYITYVFKRYVKGGYSLISDDMMISNGIFLFQKGDVIELVMSDTHNPYLEIEFDHPDSTRKYTSIFGQFLSDSDDVDNRWELHNYYGNFLMMKGLTFLAQHPELFEGSTKLAKVTAMNLSGKGFIEESNDKLVRNFERWALLYKNETGKDLGVLKLGEHVLPDSVAYVHLALDMLYKFDDDTGLHESLLNERSFRDMDDKNAYSLMQVEAMINTLRNAQGTQSYNAQTSDWDSGTRQALNYLNRAYLTMLGYEISPEASTGLYTQGGVNISGLEMRPFSRSASAIGRVMHEAYFSFVRVCQNEFVRYTAEWKKLIEQLYEENNHDKNWGGAWDFFENFFQQVDGKVSSVFKLKQKGSMRTETENKVLSMFYDALNRFKYDNSDTKIQNAINNGTYGEIPLIKAGIREKSGKIGTLKALLEQAKQDWNVMRDLLLDVDVSKEVLDKYQSLDEIRIPAYVLEDDPNRQKKLSENQAIYTTDLDFIFNLICQQGIRREFSPRMMLISSAIRGSLSFMQWSGADGLENITKEVNRYVQSKLLSRPTIDPNLNKWQAAINVIKKLVSLATLGANFKSFTRETLTGIYRAFEWVEYHPQLKSKIDLKYYKEALYEIIRDCYKNNNVMSLHMQLNQIFGTSGFSYDQMAEASTISQIAIKDLEASDLFFTTTWPDFIHRNAIVIAYLKSVGAYNAYELKDGILKYNMDLDPRFELLRKYKTEQECPTGIVKQWREVYRLYKDNFDSWVLNGYKKADGSDLKFGDKLPQALCPRDISGLKDIADSMYGNYDKETKSLMTTTLLGSLFLQFRTYGINRVQQFLDGETDTSDIHWVDRKVKNKNGEYETAYAVFDKNNTALNGAGGFAKIVPESEVSLEDIKSGNAVKMQGLGSYHINGGMVKQMVDLGASLFLFKNQEEFEKMWKENPSYKASITIFMMDTLGMLLLAALINYLYDSKVEGEYDEVDWYTKWAYNVAIGVTQDGPVWSVLSSLVGDGTPPLVGALKNWANNATSIFTGKKNFLQGVAASFGATRELAYIFNAG